MRVHRDPEQLRAVGAAGGRLGRCAGEAADELLDALPIVGDHASQRAVDDAVDSLVAALRAIEVDALGVSFALGSLAGEQPASTQHSTGAQPGAASTSAGQVRR